LQEGTGAHAYFGYPGKARSDLRAFTSFHSLTDEVPAHNLFLGLRETIMGTNLATFATWLRQDMSLTDDIEIVIDRAATPIARKQRPTTRWDHLAKQQSFSMPKVPSRRRLGDTIEEDTATERPPLSARMIKQTSFCLTRGGSGRRLGGDDGGGAARPGMGVKQSSLSSLPARPYDRQTSFNKLTRNEQMSMPRLVKQCSFKSLPRGLCDDDQSVGSRPCMQKEGSLSLPKRRSRPRRLSASSGGPDPNCRPKPPVRKASSDEATDTLSSMPRLVKQTSFDDEKGGNGTDRRRQMVKQDSITMPRPPTRTFDKDDTLSSIRQQAKQTSFTATKRQGQCSTEARLLFLYSTLAEALDVSGDLPDDVYEERDPAISRRQTRSL
jgi:hypothetical protein